MSEHQEQKALFEWAAYQVKRHPELRLLFAVPNGGLRNIVVAKKLRETGVKPGVPDLFLPTSRGPHHGLFIELKAGRGRLSQSQKDWAESLSREGYLVLTCWGWESAARGIKKYLDGKKEK